MNVVLKLCRSLSSARVQINSQYNIYVDIVYVMAWFGWGLATLQYCFHFFDQRNHTVMMSEACPNWRPVPFFISALYSVLSEMSLSQSDTMLYMSRSKNSAQVRSRNNGNYQCLIIHRSYCHTGRWYHRL